MHIVYRFSRFPDAAATTCINFPLLVHDGLLFSSINFDYVMFKSTIFGSDYC